MLKNILKRTLSCFLVLTLVVTTVSFFDLSGLFPTADATLANPGDLPDVYIVVPETFYIQPTPVWNDSTKTTLTGVTYDTVQYYINNTLNMSGGVSVVPEAVRDATTGKIWFAVSSGTVTDLKYSILGTNKSDVSMTASSSSYTSLSSVTLTSGMSEATTRTLEWVFTCKIDGRPAEYHTYTIAYAPYYTPVGVLMNQKNTENNIQMQTLAWVSGIHSYSDTSNFTKYYPRNAYGADGGIDSNTGLYWRSPMVPLLEPVQGPIDTNSNQEITDWFTTGNPAGCADPTFAEYHAEGKATSWMNWGKSQVEMRLTSQTGNITVDISRNHNFNTIPNVTTGALVSDVNWDQFLWFGFYLANTDTTPPSNDVTYTKDNRPNPSYCCDNVGDVFTGRTMADAVDGNDYPNQDHKSGGEKVYDGVWNCATPSSAGTTSKYIHMGTYGENNNNWIYLNGYLKVDVTAVDKSTLRNYLFNKQKQANVLEMDNYASFRQTMRTAYEAMGNPTATQTTVDSAALVVNAATISRTTKTTVVRHVNARTGELMDDNALEVMHTDVNANVTVQPNTYTGYTLAGKYAEGESLFDMDAWKASASGVAGNNQTITSYNSSTRTLSLSVTASDTHTKETRSTSTDIRTTNYNYFTVNPNATYKLEYEYAGTGNGMIGVICYNANGKYIGVTWIEPEDYCGLLSTTGSAETFRRETYYFCPSEFVPPEGTTSLTSANAARTRYICLVFGGYPNDGSLYTSAASSSNPLSCVFRDVTWTEVDNLFSFDDWWDSSSGAAGANQNTPTYNTSTNTLSIVSTANDTFSAALRSSGDIRTSGYDYFEIDPNLTYTLSYDYAGDCNGMIGICYYDQNGQYLGAVWLYTNVGLMTPTGSTTTFRPESFDICFMTTTISNYIPDANRSNVKYVSLCFGNYPNTVNPSVETVFRNVRWISYVPDQNMFDAAAWSASKCSDRTEGVTTGIRSINYDSGNNTIIVDNSSRDSYTPYLDGNIINSDYYYIPVDPDGTYTLDFDYASPTRGQVGVICYDAAGERIGATWLFDSFKASGDVDTYVHHTEIISPQSHFYLFNNSGSMQNKRFDVHYIALTFGNYYENSQVAAVSKYRNVTITKNNELFDMAEWAFRSANLEGTANSTNFSASDLSYESGTKTLTVTCHARDVMSSYPNALKTDYVQNALSESNKHCYFYTPVEPNTTYTFEGEYAGTGNGDLGILEYDASGSIVLPKTWAHPDSVGILNKTDSNTEFEHFETTITTKSDTRYVLLAFGGYPNDNASSEAVTCVFRDVKMHLTQNPLNLSGDSVVTYYYRPNTYYASFDGNGSTGGSMDNQKFTYDWEQKITANSFERKFNVSYDEHDGDMQVLTTANTVATATFNGWATTAGGVVSYVDQDSVKNLTSTDVATFPLYAKWTDGSVTLPTISRVGYDFLGWYTQETGGQLIGVTGTYTPTADTELHAQWSANFGVLTFNNNGIGPEGNMPDDMTLYYDTNSDPLPAPKSPYIDGWEFIGWAATEGNSGGFGDDQEHGSLGGGVRRKTQNRDVGSATGEVNYYENDVIFAETVNSIIDVIGGGESYTLYAVWRKTFDVTLVDYVGTNERTQDFEFEVYNGANDTFYTDDITQGVRTDWTADGWTMLREKGAAGYPLDSEITVTSDNNLFDIDEWWDSPSHNNDTNQTLTYDADTESLRSDASSNDVMSSYNTNNLFTEEFNYIEVDPFKTYTLGVDYAATSNVSGQIGVHFYDEDGNFIKRCWLFSATDPAEGNIHRGGDHFGSSTGLTDFQHEDIEICPTTFESSYLSDMTDAQRESVRYIVLTFGNYTDAANINSGNQTSVIFRNVTFTENQTYYGVYTQQVALTYDKNTTDTVANMPSNPAAQNRVANSALGFGADAILNPTFSLSSNELERTGYTYEGWNTNSAASTGVKSGNVTLTESTQYHAIWTAHTFSIAFDKNGVGETTDMPQPLPVTYNTASSALPLPNRTQINGWTFQGWALSNARTTVKYAAGASIPAADINDYYTANGVAYTLYAVWKKTITATFIDYVNGSQHTYPISKDVFNGASATIAAGEIPTQGVTSGWTAAGWTTSTTSMSGSSVGQLTLDQDVTYYGVYTKQVGVTYNQNATGTVTNMPTNPSQQTCSANSYSGLDAANTQNPSFTLSALEPQRVGYTFLHWNTANDDSGDDYDPGDTLTITDNVTLFAIWEAITVTVTFDVNEPYANSDAAVSQSSKNVTFDDGYGTLPVPTCTGYDFVAWYTQASGGSVVDATTTVTNENDHVLYARWSARTYWVRFNANKPAAAPTAVTGTMANQEHTFNSSLALTTNAFELTGYRFDGWSLTSGGTVDYDDGETVLNLSADPATAGATIIDLYAVWTIRDYKLTVVRVSGASEADVKVTYGTSSTINAGSYENITYNTSVTPSALLRITGYTLTGWSRDDSVAISNNLAFNMPAHDLVVTATYSINNHTLYVARSGGTSAANVEATVGSSTVSEGDSLAAIDFDTAITLSADAITGYRFSGWTSNVSGLSITNSSELNASFNMPDSDVTITANYALRSYTLTVEATVGGSVAGRYISGGSDAFIEVASGTSENYSVMYAYSVNHLVPTQATGYTFTGWTATGLTLSSSDRISLDLSFTMPADDVTLVANFDANPYTIVYHYGALTKTQNCVYDQDVRLFTNGASETATQTAFIKTGYTFVYWNTAVGGTGTDYTAGDLLTKPNFVSTRNGQFDLYAKWSQNTYSLTYVLTENGEEGAGASYPDEATFDVEFHVSAPTKNGYTFTGWNVTSGLDSSTALWGTASGSTNSTVSSSSTACVNGESGEVYFKNLASADGTSVTLTATWTPKTYVLYYASNQPDDLVVSDNTYAYNATVTVFGASVLGTTYPGWTFDHWVISVGDGNSYVPGNTFALSSLDITFADLPLDSNNDPYVQLTAEWIPTNYRIVYDLNGFTTSDLTYVYNEDNLQWLWQSSTSDAELNKESDETVPLYGAYSDSDSGVGSYFYVNTSTDIRFGLGWSFTSGATTKDVDFLSDLSISGIPVQALAAAQPVAGETNVYAVTLYMVWSTNYKTFEDTVSQFQHKYMTFPAGGNETIRGMTYTGTNVGKEVYVNAPTSARLPAVAPQDAPYARGGAEANAIWEIDTSVPNYLSTVPADYAQYNWVVGSIGCGSTTWNTASNANNMFTQASLTTVNAAIGACLSNLIFDPSVQISATGTGAILSEDDRYILTQATSALTAAMSDSPSYSSGLLAGLDLKDADLNYRLTHDDMAVYDTASYTFSDACSSGTGGGTSYKPSSDSVSLLNNAFGGKDYFNNDLESEYPPCETSTNAQNVTCHHSFNSLVGKAVGQIGLANEIFAMFGFDPTKERVNIDYFRTVDYYVDLGNGEGYNINQGLTLDSNGYVVNANCPYTTESVAALFDLIYGSRREGTYKSVLTGGINVNNLALYYQVMSGVGPSATVTLKLPRQDKLIQIVTIMSYGYHQLVLKDADYTNFMHLFQQYFDATWGVRLGQAGYALGSDNLSDYAGFFNATEYNALSTFLQNTFTESGGVIVLKPTYVKHPIVEQNCVDGRPSDPTKVRTYKNASIPLVEVQTNLAAFDFAENTECSKLCDLIDALVPATADYSAVFALIANNVQRQQDADSYMVDTRVYDTVSKREAFYPSTAANIHNQISAGSTVTYYDIWWRDYAKADAWGSTRTEADNKPAYDTDWLEHFYTASSVAALESVIEGIVWNYDKLEQVNVDGMTNGSYTEGTICQQLKSAIDGLTPKSFVIEFFKGLYTDNSLDHAGTSIGYWVGNVQKEWRFGMTVVEDIGTHDMYLSEGQTFTGWNTMRYRLGHNVTGANYYQCNLVLGETLLDLWWDPDDESNSTAVITTTDGQHYTVYLYAQWVENVTLYIDTNGGSVGVTPQGMATFTATDDNHNTPTYEYGTVLTFSNPSKTGYQFDGWSANSFRMGAHNTGSLWNPTTATYTFGYYNGQPPETDDTLELTWTANTYTVTFYKNHSDATGLMSAQTFTYDTAQTLTPNGFTRPGYKMVEWRTNEDGTGTRYTDEQSVINLTTTQNGNVDLYAIWAVDDFELEFVVGEDGVWNGWPGDTTDADRTKIVTFLDVYNKEDEDGRVWPNDPLGALSVADNKTIRSSFIGWYTDPDPSIGVLIDETRDTVTATEKTYLYARFETVISTQVKNQIQLVIEQKNANHYTIESMQNVDNVLKDILDNKIEITEAVQTRLNNAILALDEVSSEAEGDMTPPNIGVYENKKALQEAIDNGEFTADDEDIAYMLSEDTGEISYVYPGKAYYSFYCYTNSLSPAIMLSAQDVAGASGRVSYPVTFSMHDDPDEKNPSGQMRTRSGLVKSGWMKYTEDPLDESSPYYNQYRKADWTLGTNTIENPYQEDNALKYFGKNYDGTRYSHYRSEDYILLKPTFDPNYKGLQYVLYTFQLNDDSVDELSADRAKLAGAEGFYNYATEGADVSVPLNSDITPNNTVSIYVEYYNSMNDCNGDAGGQIARNGVGVSHGNALEVYTEFHENGYQNGVWVNKDYLYRNAYGASTTDFITPQFAEDGTYTSYIANDPIYGQTDVGSFYYLMKKDDPATIQYWEQYNAWLDEHPEDYAGARVAGATATVTHGSKELSALDLMVREVKTDMLNQKIREKMNSTYPQSAHVELGDYLYWPYTSSTQWSTMFYAPARDYDETLVYVHIYDRWGNTFTNILQRDLQDTKEALAAAVERGEIVVNEVGGSGIQNITISELNSTAPLNGLSGMTDDMEWNAVNNQFMISGLPKGNNNYQYTMTITDNAGSVYSSDFQAASDGSVVVTVNDETMGGSYAAAAAAPVAQQADENAVNGVGVGAIDEAPLTMLAIEEVQPDAITVDSIDEVQTAAAGAPEEEEERPDLYSFTLNEIYTVNLFADVTRDYDVKLKSTVGGIVKAYVNGEFAPVKSGKVVIPAGSQVQIRVSARAGYELQSLSMIYPDGRTLDLVGAYNAEINDDVTIKAVFVETDALLRIRVEHGAVSGKQEMLVSPYSRVAVVAEAAPEGKVFAYWSQDDQDDIPVSYDKIYTFIATSDVTMKANYADAPTERAISIAMDASSDTHVTVVNGCNTLSYSGKIVVPDDVQIVEFGLLLTNQSQDYCTNDNFVIGGNVNGVKVAKLAGKTLTEEGQCKINVNNVAPDQTRTGRLYLTVRLADGTLQTIYSNTWSELTTPAAE